MPRTLPAALTTAIDSGNYVPYIRVHVGGDGFSVEDTQLPIKYKLQDLACEVIIPLTTADVSFFSIERGAIINGSPSTIKSIWFRTIESSFNGQFLTLKGEALPRTYVTQPAESTYQDVIENTLQDANPATQISYEGTASWKNYAFYPTGKTVVLSPAKKLFALLRQKYLIFITEDGFDETYNNYFAFVATETRSTDYTIEDPLYTSTVQQEERYLLTRDENNTIRTNGSNQNLIHNLGYLHSTASLPTNKVNDFLNSRTRKIPVHLKYRTGDVVAITRNGVTQTTERMQVTEIFDANTEPAWYQILQTLEWFGTTEGGSLPSTIEAAAPYTPLATGDFDNILTENDNNLQAAMETLDDHEHLIEAFTLGGKTFAALTGGTTYNNYNPSTDLISRLELTIASGTATLTGIAGGVDGQILHITKTSTTGVVQLNHNSGSSSAANRLFFPSGVNQSLTNQGDAITFIYTDELDLWVAQIDKHASRIPITDSGAYFTGTDVEAALQELGAGGSGGGLTYTATTVTTGNVTAVNGNLYACTIAGMTADRDLNLPTPAAAGERIGVWILDGDDTYELLIKANSVEITRLFIAQEYMEFISTGTGAGDWKIAIDGRIPCKGFATREAVQSINTASTTKILLDTSVIDVGNIVDVTTNDRINVRRAGKYRVIGFVSIENLDDQETLASQVWKDGAVLAQLGFFVSLGTTNTDVRAVSPLYLIDCAVGAYFELYIRHSEGASQNTLTGTNGAPSLQVEEVF